MRTALFWFIYGLWLISSNANASTSTPTLILTDAPQQTRSAAPFMAVLEDPSHQLTLAHVTAALSHQFIPNAAQTAPSFGRSRSAYWIRFNLSNHSSQQWYALSDAFLEDEYDFYLMADNRDVTAQYAARVADYRRPAWSLALPHDLPLQVYVRATNGDSAFSLPLELVTANTMLERSKENYRLYAAIYGAMLVLAAYNLFLFFALREFSYLYLVVHILAMATVAHITQPVYMSRLMGNVLDIAKIESNRLELQQEPFQLSMVMRQVHDLIIHQAQQKGLTLHLSGHDTIPETLLGDRLRLTQILTNLLQNALRYTLDGSVTCTVQRHPAPEPQQLRLSFSVRDTGIGIAAEKLPTIFDEASTPPTPTSPSLPPLHTPVLRWDNNA